MRKIPSKSERKLSPDQQALGLLVRREHSRKELERKLAQRKVDPDEARAAIHRLAEEGWQDDSRFAEMLVRSRVSRGFGPRHIRAELVSHGLNDEVTAAAMAAFEADWPRLAGELLQRRFGEIGLSDPTQRRRAVGLLIRRGFDPGCIADNL